MKTEAERVDDELTALREENEKLKEKTDQLQAQLAERDQQIIIFEREREESQNSNSLVQLFQEPALQAFLKTFK